MHKQYPTNEEDIGFPNVSTAKQLPQEQGRCDGPDEQCDTDGDQEQHSREILFLRTLRRK
jgi:hypothetical protein